MNNKEAIKKEEFIKYLKNESCKEYRESALLPTLYKAQELFGYISREVAEEISHHLHIPSAYIWGLTTFYHYFSLKPRGRYIISVCLGTACYVKGAEGILRKIKEDIGIEVGETIKGGLFTLEAKACLGCCGLAPVMTINDRVYGELTPAKVSKILKEIEKQGSVK